MIKWIVPERNNPILTEGNRCPNVGDKVGFNIVSDENQSTAVRFYRVVKKEMFNVVCTEMLNAIGNCVENEDNPWLISSGYEVTLEEIPEIS